MKGLTKHFYASQKKLKRRYNRRIFLVNTLPLSVILVTAAIVLSNYNSVNPPSYYYAVSVIFSLAVGYGFVTVLTGSIISSSKQKNHSAHTYVEICGEMLIISRFCQSFSSERKKLVYKKLYVINLHDITDIYFYKKNVVIIAPTRLLYERADWLTYKSDGKTLSFDRWWYDKNGGTLVNGAEIKDMFSSTARIARTISNASGKARKRFEERKHFREKMLSIAQTATSEHKNLSR